MTRQHEHTAPRAWIEIDLRAVRRNAEAVAHRSGARLLPMVKADAYGLGAIAIARELEHLDPWGFGVATVAEGDELRRAGIRRRIVVFTPLWGADLDACRRTDLTPTLGDRGAIEQWIAGGGGAWHLAIDTGMSRAGVRWDAVDSLHDQLMSAPPEGAFTHFHSAERNDGSREAQEERLAAVVERLPQRPAVLHAENSAAIERARRSRWDVVRPGIFLYGVGSGPGSRLTPEPVVALRARIVEVRTLEPGETVSYGATYRAVGRRRIATLPVGYADGYRRALSNRGSILVKGCRVTVAGLVTMDMTMIDVTDVDAGAGDVATLIGEDGGQRLDVADLALAGDLSPYEVLTGLRGRVTRIHGGGA